jgi:hypothetical protein
MAVPVSSGPLARKLAALSSQPRAIPFGYVKHRQPEPPPPPDKRTLCDRYCTQREHLREVKLMLALWRARHGYVAQHVRVLARDIIRAVAEAHAISINDLLCDSHSRPLVLARHEAAYEMAQLTRLSLVQIGRALGGRDHTTIMNALCKHAQRNGLPLPRGLKPKVRKP